MGFVALLELEDGRLQLERVDGIRRLTRGQSGDRRVVAAPRDYLERYGKYEANTTLWLNINLSPHFPSVAEVARNLYWEVRDVEVDTVARVDLVAVGYLIDALGGVSVEGERIRGSDLATDFLIDSYLRFPDVVEQNEYLTRVAEVAFRQILSGERREGTQVLNALRRTLEERRASVVTWQSELDELLSSFGGSGALLSGDPGDLEVVVQNFASNKIDLFTEQAITVSAIPVGCSVFGQVELIVENAAPQWAIDLPHGELGIRGQWWVNVYLPRQAQLRALLVDGDPAEGSLEEEQGRPVAATLIAAAPGEEVTVTVRWEESISDSLYQLRLQPQPLVSPATLDLGIEDPLRFTTTQERSVSTACREAGS